MDWMSSYRAKSTTAQQAVNLIHSGDKVVIGHACGAPVTLLNAMVKNADAYTDVELIHLVGMDAQDYLQPGYEKHFIDNNLFVGAKARDAVYEGRAEYTPIFFHEVPWLLKNKLKPDVSLIQVSVPDEHGYCSYGVSVDYTKPGTQLAKTVIAQVNPKMPRTFGDSFIHVNDITAIVEADEPIIELPKTQIGAEELEIGKHCATLIQDGDTLQLGIGSLPDAVLLALQDKKHLGIHSEMIADNVVELVNKGIIDNTKKNIHNGKMIVTFLMGTRKLYDYVDNNPSVEMHTVDYVNDPYIIGKNDNLVSINSFVQIDLMGQVASDSIGLRQISGVGGQVDYVRGAALSKNGRSILATTARTKKGQSKIVPFLSEGTAVVTSRYDVSYIITEYGIAQLKGLTLKERAKALIDLAHPDDRAELFDEYERRFKKVY